MTEQGVAVVSVTADHGTSYHHCHFMDEIATDSMKFIEMVMVQVINTAICLHIELSVSRD